MARNPNWSREESLVAFRLYCHEPFGRLHQANPEIIRLAGLLGRTPSAVGMKACNFASLDPAQQARGISGLGNTSDLDKRIWRDFEAHSESVAEEAERAYERLVEGEPSPTATVLPDFPTAPVGPTDYLREVRVRRVQRFFRNAVLISYDGRCALTEVAIPGLLVASHIIPWSQDEHRRADPRNGLCLNALHDRAFDAGLVTFDEQLRLVVSRRVRNDELPEFQRHAFVDLEGKALRLPGRFQPDPAALEYHRNKIFRVD